MTSTTEIKLYMERARNTLQESRDILSLNHFNSSKRRASLMVRDNLTHLQSIERQALFEFRQQLQTQFNDLIWLIILFGSKARGDSNYASDLDVLIVVNSDDWQLHKQISYLATDISLEYALNLSPRIWSVSHFHYMQDIKASFYQNIQRDGIILHQNETTVDKLLT